MNSTLPDGLYQVTTAYLCAGFTVKGGERTDCAPILRNKIGYWRLVEKRIEDQPKSLRYSNPHLRILSDAALAEQTERCVKSNCAVEA